MTDTVGPPRHIVAILLCVIPLSQIPLDVYTPALPQMVTDLASTPAALQATVTVYMLGLAIGFIPVGVMADAWGRKRVLLTCLVGVASTSVLCAVAPSVTFLLIARFLQGLAACACMVLSYAVAAECFRGAKLTSVSGILGAAWGLEPTNRTPIAARATSRAVAHTLRNPVFGCFVLVFGLLASAQLAFGVAGPFLYQEQLGFQPAA